MMSGYSGTPLHRKLGLKPGMRVHVFDAPLDFREWLGSDCPAFGYEALGPGTECVLIFSKERAELEAKLTEARSVMARDGMIWACWPKKASKVASDITEDVVREVALPTGLVDVKVCAVSEVWSGLKLVIRKELR